MVCWVRVATSRRARPTLTMSHRKNGSRKSDSTVSGTERTSMAMRVLMMTTTFASTLEAVSVTTDCTPPTSFDRPGLDLAGPRAGEEAQRHRLQVLVQRVAQVLHHAEADQVRHVGLPDPDDARDDRDHDHQSHVEVEEAEPGAGEPAAVPRWVPEERPVEDPLDQDGVGDAEPRGDHDGQGDDGHLPPVRAEGGHHATDRLPLDRTVVVRRGSRVEAAVPAHRARIRVARDSDAGGSAAREVPRSG